MGFQLNPVIVMWIAILLIVFVTTFFSYLSRRSRYRLLEKIAEKGQPLSPELLSSLGGNGRGDRVGRGGFTGGIFMMCIGIALAVFFWAMQGGGIPFNDGNWLPVVGIFPFMVGLARVLGAMFDKRDTK